MGAAIASPCQILGRDRRAAIPSPCQILTALELRLPFPKFDPTPKIWYNSSIRKREKEKKSFRKLKKKTLDFLLKIWYNSTIRKREKISEKERVKAQRKEIK